MVRLCNQTPLPRSSTRVSKGGTQNARFKELLSHLTPVLSLPTPRPVSGESSRPTLTSRTPTGHSLGGRILFSTSPGGPPAPSSQVVGFPLQPSLPSSLGGCPGAERAVSQAMGARAQATRGEFCPRYPQLAL